MKYTKSYKKICAMCGKEFVAHTALQKYCDAVCGYYKTLENQRNYYKRRLSLKTVNSKKVVK